AGRGVIEVVCLRKRSTHIIEGRLEGRLSGLQRQLVVVVVLRQALLNGLLSGQRNSQHREHQQQDQRHEQHHAALVRRTQPRREVNPPHFPPPWSSRRPCASAHRWARSQSSQAG